MESQTYEVYAVRKEDTMSRKKIGWGFTLPNGHIQIDLDALPVNGRIILEPQK